MAKRIEPQEAHEMMRSGARPTVIDVRDEGPYREAHIPGAIHIPSDQLEARLGDIPRDRPVIVY